MMSMMQDDPVGVLEQAMTELMRSGRTLTVGRMWEAVRHDAAACATPLTVVSDVYARHAQHDALGSWASDRDMCASVARAMQELPIMVWDDMMTLQQLVVARYGDVRGVPLRDALAAHHMLCELKPQEAHCDAP
jgi:hypothetical protein